MASNTTPNFTRDGSISSALVTAGNGSSQGGGTVGTDEFLVLTADATNGTFVDYIQWIPTATANTTTTAAVGRVYISSKTSGATTSADTYLFNEVALPAVNADGSTAAINAITVPCNFRLPAGYAILVQNSVAPAANTAWRATGFGGDY